MRFFQDAEKALQEALSLNMGKQTRDGSVVVQTGAFTGRAADLRFISQRKELESTIDWGAVNKPIPMDFAQELFGKLEGKFERTQSYSMQAFVGPFPLTVISTSPWHIAFALNMFRKSPVASVTALVKPGQNIRILHDPYGKISDLGLKSPSETAIVLDPITLKVAIVGTAYAGEIKKSAFTLCNYLLPDAGVFPMHASANCLSDGSQSCVLFGLSGTGKTTLSASSDRKLIGDDEIIWTENGISNLEGGCYAKLIDLDPDKEPEIYRAVHQPSAILENVGWKVVTSSGASEIDFSDRGRTENTRGSYPLTALSSVYRQDVEARAPKTIVFLTADAFGAFPAVAKLNRYQAQYHFLSGYTAKVAGTELGVTEPKTAFSTCFGAPFMPRHPSVYAKLLDAFTSRSGANVWILNTGWTKGGYGKGPRFPIEVSRTLLQSIQSGDLETREKTIHPVFGFEVPKHCPGVASEYLEVTLSDSVTALAKKFSENMKKFSSQVDTKVIEFGGPRV